ncbi:GNAT family N-acetyltransferase [Halobacillus sp. Marseille-P3879]|uniref:GNAT family N-acetyltransferase n=1 Tax=Halobacillus sp. Marseille-P3879 TaxID=2045014 RepID=UPI000C7D36EC|nr:GNAT family N-acetyltransferase [Halobacillus sp. Marseille-P3879]
MVTFKNIYRIGHLIDDNMLYKHIHYPEMLTRYDSNYLEFKKMPSVTEFREAHHFLRSFHLKNGQKHVKFYLPKNQEPDHQLIAYFKEHHLETGFQELYQISPEEFPKIGPLSSIKIEWVNEQNFHLFLQLHYAGDLEFGQEFAGQKIDFNRRLFNAREIEMLLAYYKGEPAGTVTIIHSGPLLEIDHLVVEERFQRKGIGARLQQQIMDRYPEKRVVLVADGEDTPRHMYRKQNYQFSGFQYEVQKID